MSSERNDHLIKRLKTLSDAVDAANDLSATQKDKFYQDLPSRIDTILGDDAHLHKLKQIADAHQAYIKEFDHSCVPVWEFGQWLLDRWGIQLKTNDSASGLSGFEVVDEQKFLLFQMVFP